MIELNPWLFAVFMFTAFLFGVAVCYVYGLKKISDQVDKASLWALDVLENTQDLIDDTKHIQDKLDQSNKTITLEHAIGLALMDQSWEIDNVFDDISGKTTAFVDETGLPADNAFVIEFDENITYTVVAPKRTVQALRRVMKIRESQQEISNLPYSTRAFKSDIDRPTPPPVVPTSILSPSLMAAVQQHQEKAS